MIVLSFGNWSTAAGRWFVRDRIYKRWGMGLTGWTPLVRVRRRYR